MKISTCTEIKGIAFLCRQVQIQNQLQMYLEWWSMGSQARQIKGENHDKKKRKEKKVERKTENRLKGEWKYSRNIITNISSNNNNCNNEHGTHNIESIQFGSVVIFQNLIVLRTNISHSTTQQYVHKGFADRTLSKWRLMRLFLYESVRARASGKERNICSRQKLLLLSQNSVWHFITLHWFVGMG